MEAPGSSCSTINKKYFHKQNPSFRLCGNLELNPATAAGARNFHNSKAVKAFSISGEKVRGKGKEKKRVKKQPPKENVTTL